jgi:HSP20 family molecular chaperone IbpA
MGTFSRTVKLAKDLDASTIVAKVDRGVLHVTAQKFPAVEPVDDSVEISID